MDQDSERDNLANSAAPGADPFISKKPPAPGTPTPKPAPKPKPKPKKPKPKATPVKTDTTPAATPSTPTPQDPTPATSSAPATDPTPSTSGTGAQKWDGGNWVDIPNVQGKRKVTVRLTVGRLWGRITGLFGDSTNDDSPATAGGGIRGTTNPDSVEKVEFDDTLDGKLRAQALSWPIHIQSGPFWRSRQPTLSMKTTPALKSRASLLIG